MTNEEVIYLKDAVESLKEILTYLEKEFNSIPREVQSLRRYG